MPQPVILAAKRTPIGRFLGGLSRTPAPQLGGLAIDAAMNSDPNLPRDAVDEVIMGCVLQAGLGQNPARQAALKAGFPDTISAQTVNKVCGSGLQAVMTAAQSIKAGDNALVVAGGMENMSLAPHFDYVRTGVKYGDSKLTDHMAHDGLTCPFEGWAMGCAAEHTAKKHGITRAEQDRFAEQSHRRAAEATDKCWFGSEKIELTGEQIGNRRKPGPEGGVQNDEGIRPDTSADALAKLPTVFAKDDGTVTAGNASQISDGAAAVVVASEEKADALGVTPMARIIDYYTSGVAPKDIFDAPAIGIKTLLERNNLTVGDIDLFEINEAFCAQLLANIGALGISEDKLNICGGGIALGHPIGASGARVLTTLLHQMKRTGANKGVASLCLGGGNSVSMLVEM